MSGKRRTVFLISEELHGRIMAQAERREQTMTAWMTQVLLNAVEVLEGAQRAEERAAQRIELEHARAEVQRKKAEARLSGAGSKPPKLSKEDEFRARVLDWVREHPMGRLGDLCEAMKPVIAEKTLSVLNLLASTGHVYRDMNFKIDWQDRRVKLADTLPDGDEDTDEEENHV